MSMVCDLCGQTGIRWVGPFSNLTHTECPHCGGVNCQRADDLDPDAFVECQACYGKGFNDVERQVAERKSDVQTFRETCEACDGTGKVNAGGVA